MLCTAVYYSVLQRRAEVEIMPLSGHVQSRLPRSNQTRLPVTSSIITMADFDDFDDDEFGDLDDADFVEAANKLENQTPRLIQTSKRPPTPKGFKNGSEFADLLEGAFNSDDILEDELEITGHTTVQRPTRSLPSNFRQGPPPAHNRQTTLFGGIAPESSQQPTSQVERVTLTNMNEPPTHHKLDLEAAKTWIYPTNMGHRDYQYNIVKKSLFTNVLAALPTGMACRIL